LRQKVGVGIGVIDKIGVIDRSGCFYIKTLELSIVATYLYTFHDIVLLPIQFIGDGEHPSQTSQDWGVCTSNLGQFNKFE
jgi:hypothetical protein